MVPLVLFGEESPVEMGFDPVIVLVLSDPEAQGPEGIVELLPVLSLVAPPLSVVVVWFPLPVFPPGVEPGVVELSLLPSK